MKNEPLNIVCYGTENCEKDLEFFYDNLVLFCPENFNLHYFSINYNSNIERPNLQHHNFFTNKKFKRAFFYKPFVILKSMTEISSDNFIYMDLDIMLTNKFDSSYLFDLISESITPLSPNHFWENPFKFYDDIKVNLGEKLSEITNTVRCNKYVQACLVVYNRNHFEFLTDWISLINNTEILDIAYDDEEIYNTLLWKNNQIKTLGYVCVSSGAIRIDNMDDIQSIVKSHEKFEKCEFNKSFFTIQNNFYKNLEINNIMLFHGIKL